MLSLYRINFDNRRTFISHAWLNNATECLALASLRQFVLLCIKAILRRCLGGGAVGRRTSDLAVMCSIPGPGVIRHLDQLSLPSLRGR